MAAYCYILLYDWCYPYALLAPATNLQRGEPTFVDRSDNLFFKAGRCSLLPKAENTSYRGDQWAVRQQCEDLDRTELVLYIFMLFIPLCHWFTRMALYKLTMLPWQLTRRITVSCYVTPYIFVKRHRRFRETLVNFDQSARRHILKHYDIATIKIPLLSRWWNFAHNTKSLGTDYEWPNLMFKEGPAQCSCLYLGVTVRSVHSESYFVIPSTHCWCIMGFWLQETTYQAEINRPHATHTNTLSLKTTQYPFWGVFMYYAVNVA
jgi:hypothetical protein